ncbi:MAG: hypothetical protein AB7U63_09170 [Porticoccaceae bacterium]
MSNVKRLKMTCLCCKELLTEDNKGRVGRCNICIAIFDSIIAGCQAKGFTPPFCVVWQKVGIQRIVQKLPDGLAEKFCKLIIAAENNESVKTRRETIRRNNKKR